MRAKNDMGFERGHGAGVATRGKVNWGRNEGCPESAPSDKQANHIK
jgi:hypothetical protein